MKLNISENRIKTSHYGNSAESRRKEIADRFGKIFNPDDHMLTCKDGKVLNIQIGKKYRCTAFDNQKVEIVDIEDILDDGSAMLDVAYRNKRYTVASTQLYESKLRKEASYTGRFKYTSVSDVAIDIKNRIKAAYDLLDSGTEGLTETDNEYIHRSIDLLTSAYNDCLDLCAELENYS